LDVEEHSLFSCYVIFNFIKEITELLLGCYEEPCSSTSVCSFLTPSLPNLVIGYMGSRPLESSNRTMSLLYNELIHRQLISRDHSSHSVV
jgi:hypothetical protein